MARSGATTLLVALASPVYAQDPAPAAPEEPAPAPAPVQTEPVTLAAPAPEPPPSPTAIDPKLQVGVGLRTEFILDPDREGDQDSPTYAMNSDLRPYIAGQVNEYIKFEGNLSTNGSDINLLDAVLKFEFHDYFNLWTGHFLPPSDRSNLSGPYFLNAWNYPSGVHAYPSGFAGRDDGFAIWGQVNGGQVKWQLGFFGMSPGGLGSLAFTGGNPDPRFAGRVTVNLLDPEPGYYNSSTYYGTKDILAFGAVLQHQPAPEGLPDEAADTLWSLDALYENTFAGVGTLDVEGAFYGFGGADAGTSFFVLGSFLFPDKVGIGQLQPMVRLQRAGWSDGDAFAGVTAPVDEDASLLTIDAGLHYIINGHNARLAATFRYNSLSVADANDVTDTVIVLGGQIQAF